MLYLAWDREINISLFFFATFLYENEAPSLEQAAVVTMATRVLRPLKRAFLCISPGVPNCMQNLKGGLKIFISQDVWFLQRLVLKSWTSQHICRCSLHPRSQTPDQKSANFSPILIFVICPWNYFASIWKTLSLKCFQIAPTNIKSVTSQLAVFTYTHLSRLTDLWEGANYLIYFITVGSFVFDHANHTRWKMKISGRPCDGNQTVPKGQTVKPEVPC